MNTSPSQLLDALAFAATKHRDQRRKNTDASPYINHPIEVARLLATVGGVIDSDVLRAAILRDTVEDTDTTPDELAARFGATVRDIVMEVTDDKTLPKDERKQRQIEHAPTISVAARLIKLGDKISNVRDITNTPPDGWPMTRRREYLDWTEAVIAGCRGVNAALEQCYDDALAEGRDVLLG